MGVVHRTKLRQKFACILEADESRRMRVGNSIPHRHEDHIAGKVEKFTAALQFGSSLFLCVKLKFRQRKQQVVIRKLPSCRHHVLPRVKIYLPREESFTVSLKYIDVSRTIFEKNSMSNERNASIIIGMSMNQKT